MNDRRPIIRSAWGTGGVAIMLAATASSPGLRAQPDDSLPTIRRNEFGVPHILANSFRGIGIGLAYTQVEDYGDRVILGALRSKGWMGRTFGKDSMSGDFAAQLDLMRVQETYPPTDKVPIQHHRIMPIRPRCLRRVR